MARETRGGDPMVAQLLALIESLSSVVLFRMTAEEYKDLPKVLPRAEVFIRVLQNHAPSLAVTIARSWELLDPSVVACQEQVDRVTPSEMTPLGGTLYFGQLVGALATLVSQGRYSEEGAFGLLQEQGLEAGLSKQAWQKALQVNT
jgi:hypothetical protein